jgi:glycosyltransferase involved in cell wall biosynthesis
LESRRPGKMNVKYCGPAKDYSGYGEAVRHDIGSLVAAGVEVTCEVPRYTRESTDFGTLGEIVDSLKDRQIGYNIKIIHTTPDQFRKYHEPDKYNIGRVFWETDKLPPEFAEPCELMDEIWTGSEFNADAIRKAGVNKPIFIIPEAIDANISPDDFKPYKTAADGTFTFYSIFEWTERKNPDALLRAFWSEFAENDNVSLVIKTYLDDFSVSKRREISTAVSAIKAALQRDYYAPVYLYRDLMLRQQIYRFHKSFHCFVSAHRGEGWGIPQMEAMLMGRPIISTNLGGIHEYLTNGQQGYMLDCDMVPVRNTRNSQWYLPEQNWGNVSIDAIRAAMRAAYEKKEESTKMGVAGRQLVCDKFSLEAVGDMMLERLEEIRV